MPWNEVCVMDERESFLKDVNESEESFAALCRRYGISRKTGYKWVERYEEVGRPGLRDRRPMASSHPDRVSEEQIDELVGVRRQYPFWGPKKILTWLQEHRPEQTWPAASTIGDKLKIRGYIRPRRRRLRVPMSLDPLAAADHPNETWCIDFKGHFALGDKTRCYPLTLTDQHTRYLLQCEGMTEPRFEPVQQHLTRAFREYGMPRRIRSDNGPPFASLGWGGLSRLSVWWIQLGVTPERIEPGKPQQNGRHERMHRTLKQETASPPCGTMLEQQRLFDRFRGTFNDDRPHEALGQRTPASRYTSSHRAFPDKLCAPTYPETMRVLRVDAKGRFSFFGHHHLTPTLAGQPVGIEPIDEDTWELFYGPVLLGAIHVRTPHARPERAKRQ
jgi:transposase InsO family protein